MKKIIISIFILASNSMSLYSMQEEKQLTKDFGKLFNAIKKSDKKTVEELVDNDLDLLNCVDIEEENVMHYVAQYSGSVEIAQYFSNKKPIYQYFDEKDTFGLTPLFYAIDNNFIDLALFLISNCHANCYAKISRKKSGNAGRLIHYAVIKKLCPIVEAFLEKDPDMINLTLVTQVPKKTLYLEQVVTENKEFTLEDLAELVKAPDVMKKLLEKYKNIFLKKEKAKKEQSI